MLFLTTPLGLLLKYSHNVPTIRNSDISIERVARVLKFERVQTDSQNRKVVLVQRRDPLLRYLR